MYAFIFESPLRDNIPSTPTSNCEDILTALKCKLSAVNILSSNVISYIFTVYTSFIFHALSNSPTLPMLSGGRRHIWGLLSLSGGYVVIFFFKFMFNFLVVAQRALVALGAAKPRGSGGANSSPEYPNNIRGNKHRKNSYPMLITCLSLIHLTVRFLSDSDEVSMEIRGT